jgi:hypothetical protein
MSTPAVPISARPASLRRLSWVPAVVITAGFAGLLLAWDPHVRDLAAQTFRTELFQKSGFAIWNGSWYGGHYTLTYSVLFPPLASLLGTRLLGALSVVASTYLFDRLIRARWGDRAKWAIIWYGVGAVGLLASGQLTFAFGAAVALLALRLLQLGRRKEAMAASIACALASPVAAVFLAGILLAGAAAQGIRRRRLPVAMGLAALAVVIALNWAFPESGRFPFVFSSFIGIPLWCGGALALTWALPQEREFRVIVWAYLAGGALMWLIPNPMGGNAIRLGATFGGPVLAAILLSQRPRPHWSPAYWALIGIMLISSVYWQGVAGVRAVAQSNDDPSTQASYYVPVRSWLRDHDARQARIEVPPTANHWESAYLAPSYDLARGWLRQLDTTRDRVFYNGRLTDVRYRRWLHRNGVRYVVLPDAKLDYSAQAERALILSSPSYLRPLWSSAHWRVYAVRRPGPLVLSRGAGRAQMVSLGAESFAVRVARPGAFTVLERYTPYWAASGPACLRPAGDWTELLAPRAGTVRVSIHLTPGRVLAGLAGSGGGC